MAKKRKMFRLLFLNSQFDQAKPGAARAAKFASQHKFWSLTEQYCLGGALA
jgi:hypothetical protein